jgi:transglutaminase-like putative cysteine protease
MKYKITHTTNYTYSKEVFFEPFKLRLKPKSNSFQKLQEFGLSITPEPEGKTETLDLEDNNIVTVWFEGTYKKLVIKSGSIIEPLNKNPFSFIITNNSFFNLPIKHSDNIYRPFLNKITENNKLTNLINPIIEKSKNQTIEFLFNLNNFIYQNFEKIIRETGMPWTPFKTIKENKGSCRDLTVLFMECCRSVGLPSRFTSGYNEIDIDIKQRQLHAWAEVFIPGGGWLGYDPTLGLAVGDKHVSLASSSLPANTYPISGSFRGTGVNSELTYEIKIEQLQ